MGKSIHIRRHEEIARLQEPKVRIARVSHLTVTVLTVTRVVSGHTEAWCAVMSDKTVTLSEERIAYLEGLVRQARTAAAVFTQLTQEDVDRIVKPMVLAGLEQAQYLARLAVEETKIGVIEKMTPIGSATSTRLRSGYSRITPTVFLSLT